MPRDRVSENQPNRSLRLSIFALFSSYRTYLRDITYVSSLRTENTDDFRETRRNPCAILRWHEGEKSHGYGGERVATYLWVACSIRRKEETSFHVAMEVTGAVPFAGRKGKRKREAAAREREERRTDNVASFIRAVL